MFRSIPRLNAMLFAGVLLVLAGCSQDHYGLFADPDAATDVKIRKYYDNDSARVTTENRRRNSDMGFGLPAGFGQQQ